MLNDVKPPPLTYGLPEDGTGPLPPGAAHPGPRHVSHATVPHAHAGVQQPPAHRDVLEGHPELPRHEPASAHTPEYVRQHDDATATVAAARHRQVSPEVARGARRGDVSDGATYEYPTRGSFDNTALSVIVVLVVVAAILVMAFGLSRLF